MDRVIVYPGAIPQDQDVLKTNQNAMIAAGYLARAMLGYGTIADGLECGPTSPPSMQVLINPGAIYALEVIEASAYGSLPPDGHPLVKMGIKTDWTLFPLTAPTTPGFSQNYLIEGAFQEADVNPVVLPYYNANNPNQPYSGPPVNGQSSNIPQDTLRQQKAGLQLIAGAPAPTGTQTTPPVDAGWIGLWIITVSFGDTTIVSDDILQYSPDSFIQFKLPQLSPGLLNTQYFFTAGTYHPVFNNHTTLVEIELGGGCGGSGGIAGGGLAGSPGAGSGAFCLHKDIAPSFAGLTLVVGVGGAAGVSGGGSGGNGGDSAYGSLTAPGGVGGAGCGTAIAFLDGGAGGARATGANIVNSKGQRGGSARNDSGNLEGQGGTMMYNRQAGDGRAGSAAIAGNAGDPGFCIIREYRT